MQRLQARGGVHTRVSPKLQPQRCCRTLLALSARSPRVSHAVTGGGGRLARGGGCAALQLCGVWQLPLRGGGGGTQTPCCRGKRLCCNKQRRGEESGAFTEMRTRRERGKGSCCPCTGAALLAACVLLLSVGRGTACADIRGGVRPRTAAKQRLPRDSTALRLHPRCCRARAEPAAAQANACTPQKAADAAHAAAATKAAEGTHAPQPCRTSRSRHKTAKDGDVGPALCAETARDAPVMAPR